MEGLYQALVAVEPTTLVVTILNLFLQMYLVKKFLLNKVLDVLERRRKMVDQELEEAEMTKQAAQGTLRAYEADRDRIKEQVGQIMERANRQANDRGVEIIRDAQEQALRIREKAEANIAYEKKKAINEAKDRISQIALEIAEKVIGHTLDKASQGKLVDRFIEELEGGE